MMGEFQLVICVWLAVVNEQHIIVVVVNRSGIHLFGPGATPLLLLYASNRPNMKAS